MKALPTYNIRGALGTRNTSGRAAFHSSESAPAGTVVADSTDGAANQDGYPPGPYVTNMSSVNSTLMILVDLLTVW